MSRLNPRQQEAVNYVGGPLLVLAGAGSGKTSVITRKIAYLVQQCGIRAQYIVAVTFTNKAAREMKERVGTLLRGGEGKGLTVSTFHNLGLNIIRKEHERLGYKPGFSIFDESDIKALLTDIMQKEYSGDDGVDEIKNYIGAWKNDLILPEEALEKARNPKEQTAAIVYLHYQRTLRAFVKILKAAAVDFAVLGLEERDSGDVARRLGDEATFQNLARRNIATLAKYRFTRIVSCDPHSFHVLKNEYGALGGDYQVLHHSTFIDELLRAGTLQPGRSKAGSVTYHDPCYLGRYNGEYEAPRNVLRALGIEVKEMQRSGFRSRCCGGGGGAPITDIPGKQRIPDMRMADIRETGAELVAVGCPQCTAMLEGVVAPRPEIKDIAELVAEALIEQAEAPAKKPLRREAVAEVH